MSDSGFVAKIMEVFLLPQDWLKIVDCSRPSNPCMHKVRAESGFLCVLASVRGCALSPILLMTVMDRIWWRSHGEEVWITSLVVWELFVLCCRWWPAALWIRATEQETASRRISTSKYGHGHRLSTFGRERCLIPSERDIFGSRSRVRSVRLAGKSGQQGRYHSPFTALLL